jgi:cell division septal protein FtsQ
MPISEVAVVGAEYVDPETIRDAAGVSVSAPTFSIDDDSVIGRVEALPWVLGASVRRRLSGRFEIRVVERTPVALIWREGFHLLDASGRTARLEGRAAPDVPLVTGLPRAALGSREQLEHLGWALRLVSELEPLRSTVSEVSLADTAMIVLVLSPNGTPVFFPRQPGRDRFVTAASLVAVYPEVVRQARYLDARFSGHVVVGS